MELPLFDDDLHKALVILAGALVTLGGSGRIIAWLFPDALSRATKRDGTTSDPRDPRALRDSMIVGKAENLLTLLFVLAGELTGIALLVAAKSLVRKEDIARDPGYFLGGTLVNLTWGLMMGLALRLVAIGPF